MSVQEIKEQALKLPPEDREMLAQELWQSLDDEPLDPEFEAELNRRWEEIESGKVKTIPHEQVMAEMSQKLKEMREDRISSGSKD